MNNPLVSIIIPTYNRCEFLKETLKSVEEQIYTNWECIVIDDGSNDNTETYMSFLTEKKSKYKYYKRPSRLIKGANSCRNFGLKVANGVYVNWFDDDDIMLNNFISSKIFALGELNYDFVINTGCFTDENLGRRKKIDLFQTENLYKDYFLWKLKVLTPSVLFKKQFLKMNSYIYDDKLTTSHEFDFFCKIFSRITQNRYKLLNEVTFLYRGHFNSTTFKNQSYNKAFKESEVIAVARNFKLSKNDSIIYQSVFRLLINQLIKARKNKHHKNIDFIKNSIYNNSKKNKMIIQLVIFCLLKFPVFSDFILLDKFLKLIPIIKKNK